MRKILLIVIAAISLQANGQVIDTAGMDGRIRERMYILTSDSLDGRKMESEGGIKAARYIANNFYKDGLKPFAGNYIDVFDNSELRNVSAVVAGSDEKLKNEVIVIGGHYDHVGKAKSGTINRGANDNASGTIVMMELAKMFVANPAKRTTVFVGFDGEEQGLLGSKQFCDEWDATNGDMVAMFNFDMAGSLNHSNELRVEGVGSIAGAEEMAKSIKAEDYKLNVKPTGFVWGNMTDTDPFLNYMVPAVYIYTFPKTNIHTINDIAESIDYKGMGKITMYAYELINKIANGDLKANEDVVREYKKHSLDDKEGIKEIQDLFNAIQGMSY